MFLPQTARNVNLIISFPLNSCIDCQQFCTTGEYSSKSRNMPLHQRFWKWSPWTYSGTLGGWFRKAKFLSPISGQLNQKLYKLGWAIWVSVGPPGNSDVGERVRNIATQLKKKKTKTKNLPRMPLYGWHNLFSQAAIVRQWSCFLLHVIKHNEQTALWVKCQLTWHFPNFQK